MTDNFLSKLRPTDGGCLLYTGAVKKPDGYGWISRRRTQMSAHRWAWIFLRGEIPAGLSVLHRCNERACCNVEHLYLGTQKENVRDCIAVQKFTVQKLSGVDVQWIRAWASSGEKSKNIAQAFGVSHSHIRSIVKGRFWRTA